MESVTISFKKLQRGIIETFIKGAQWAENKKFSFQILEDSHHKHTLQILYCDREDNERAVHSHSINLLAYRMNDIRMEGVSDYLAQRFHDGLQDAKIEDVMYRKDRGMPYDQVIHDNFLNPIKPVRE